MRFGGGSLIKELGQGCERTGLEILQLSRVFIPLGTIN